MVHPALIARGVAAMPRVMLDGVRGVPSSAAEEARP
jgi:hypothetical protein